MPIHYSESCAKLQVLFPVFFGNIPCFFRIFSLGNPISQQLPFPPGDPAPIRLRVHQNDVRPDAADAVPGDAEILPPSRDSQIPAGSRHHNGPDLPLRHFDLHIRHKSQPPAIPDADHLPALQIGKFQRHSHPLFPGIWYSLCPGVVDNSCQALIFAQRKRVW